MPMDPPFGPNVRVSEDDTPGNQNEITMAVASDGRIHMGWNDARQPNPDYRCGYSYSTDGGLTWSANRLFHVPGWDADGDPVVVVDADDTVYFICMPFSRSGGGSQIVVYNSTDGGVTWSAPATASDTTNGFNDKPWAHAAGTTLHVCYANFAGGGTELRYTRSFDRGATWEPTRILDRNGNGCVFASTNAGDLHLAWVRGGVIYALRSLDQGTSWSAPRPAGPAPFTSAPDQRAGPLPAIAADWTGGQVYLVWTADDGMGGWDVRFSASMDRGITWTAYTTVHGDRTNRQFMPAIDVDAAGTIHVAWYDNRTGRMAFRHSASYDRGVTWTPSDRVTDTEWVTSFFIGDYTALVARGGFVNIGWADVRSGEVEAYFARASFAGPPALDRIVVAPPEAWTTADDPVQFTASGFDQYGNPFPVNPTWAATGGTIAAGWYTPRQVGTWTVWANQSGVSGTGTVHVSPGALARVDVTPADPTITADDTMQFVAEGWDANGNPVPLAGPSWAVGNGTIAAGLFEPWRTGTWAVYANESGVSGSTSVTVLPGALAAIVVTPPSVTISADDSVQYAATGYDAKGNVAPIAPLWTAGGGSISSQGRYSAAIVGVWTVAATAEGRTGTAQVTVLPGALVRIDVEPPDAVVSADDSVQYTARGFDGKGNEIPLTPVWSATAGSIDPAGLYTPGPVGTYAITASWSGVNGSTSVTVVPGALARIEVVPATATITADDLLALTANGYDARGNRVAVAPTWSATCGTVGPDGLYTPGPARLCTVYANASGLSGSAAITVLPGRLARIDVTPPVAAITADDTLQYAARGFDAKGNEVAIVPQWRATEGTISADGLYTPRLVGEWEVQAVQGPVTGTARVTVSPGRLAAIFVEPPDRTVRADETLAFTARGEDRAGNLVVLTDPVWDATNGSVSDGLFDPHTVGTWEVSAEQDGVRGTAIARVLPGAVARVVVTPGTAALREGGRSAFTAVAYDANGNHVPDAQITWRVEGGIGTVDATGMFLGTRAGSGEVVATASDGRATASGSAAVLVDASASPLLWLLLILVVPLLLFLVVWWRRRRRVAPDLE